MEQHTSFTLSVVRGHVEIERAHVRQPIPLFRTPVTRFIPGHGHVEGLVTGVTQRVDRHGAPHFFVEVTVPEEEG